MPEDQNQQSLSGGQIAALVARACTGKDTSDCTLEFALNALQKKHPKIFPAYLEKAKEIAQRVLHDVVGKENTAEELEAFATKVENLAEPFAAESDQAGEKKGFSKVSVASKAELQAAVKTLGMGPSAYKGLPKDDPEAYCQELQNRVLTYVKNVSGDSYESLPSAEELEEMKKAAEAKKELSSLDASNIIEAIKRDIAQDLEREAAQAASEPQKKKQKAENKNEDATDNAAAPASSSSSSSSKAAKEKEAEKADSEEEEESDDDEGSCSEGSQDSSGSESSEDDEEEEEEEE